MLQNRFTLLTDTFVYLLVRIKVWIKKQLHDVRWVQYSDYNEHLRRQVFTLYLPYLIFMIKYYKKNNSFVHHIIARTHTVFTWSCSEQHHRVKWQLIEREIRNIDDRAHYGRCVSFSSRYDIEMIEILLKIKKKSNIVMMIMSGQIEFSNCAVTSGSYIKTRFTMLEVMCGHDLQ